MKARLFFCFVAVVLTSVVALPAFGQDSFIKTLGGGGEEYGNSVVEVSDGGLVVTGWTRYGAGSSDLLLAKFDGSGNHLWTRTLGGSDTDGGYSVVEVSDGGLVVTGWTESYDAGDRDLLLSKFDGSGNHLWTKTLGGSDWDGGRSVVEVSDGGLVVTGWTRSFGAVSDDLLLAKFDGSGNHLWTKTLGGSDHDEGRSVVEVSDGGLVVTGFTKSYGAGYYDLLLAKFDDSGNHLWTKTLGGSYDDRAHSVVEVSDGGLVVAGGAWGYGAGSDDFLLSKFDGSGNHLWTRILGESHTERGRSVVEVSDGGFIVTGVTQSFGAVYHEDLLLAKLDGSGNHLWTRTLGGSNMEFGLSVVEVSDGGFIVTGVTDSYGAGSPDANLLLAKFDGSGNSCLGEFVTPEVYSVSPDTASHTPPVTPQSPTIGSPTPTVTSPTPTITVVCDVQPMITSITDVGNDQGKQVRVKWHRCYWDSLGSPVTITEYSLWRRVDQYKSSGSEGEILPATEGNPYDRIAYPPGEWDFVKTVPARGESTYSTICPTLADSTISDGMYWSVSFISAMTPNPLIYFDSDPDSGYSVDNLAPAVPEGLRAIVGADSTMLMWEPNVEEDLAYYAIYRGSCPDFVPDTPFDYSIDTTYVDQTVGYCYKVSAFDFAGNESPLSEAVSAWEGLGGFLAVDTMNADIPVVISGDTLAIFNFTEEELDSVGVMAYLALRPPHTMPEDPWVYRFYSITAYPDTGDFEATMTLFYDQAEFDSSGLPSEDSLGLFRFSNSTWVFQEGEPGSVDTVANSVTLSGVTQFSYWAISDPEFVEVHDTQAINEIIPESFVLAQNYPNPFNPQATIRYSLPEDAQVRLEIYNLLGQRVITLVDEKQTAGPKSVHWGSKSQTGNEVSSGIYFYRLQAGEFVETKRMVLLK